MTAAQTREQEVLAQADALVRAFASGRVDDYFACFADDATFVFHTTPERLDSRAAYRALWERWEREDAFAVVSCASMDPRVQLTGDDTAVFTHEVRTRVRTTAGEEDLCERETIVFARRDERWCAIHEHLSPAPAAG
jgi:ketosteroid isomerase-like protein